MSSLPSHSWAASALSAAGLTAALTAALSAVLAVGAGPARADSDVHRDPAQDVVLGVEEGAPIPTVPDQTTADVVRIKTSYTTGKVRLAATTRAPLPTTGQSELTWTVRTNRRSFDVGYSTRGTRTDLYVDARSADEVPCPGLSTRVRGATRVITVPSGCLGDPRWVRTGLYVGVRNNAGPGTFVDDARRTGLPYATSISVLGPKVEAD